MNSALHQSSAPCNADYDCASCKCDFFNDGGFVNDGGAAGGVCE
jgi:hypothetical protein